MDNWTIAKKAKKSNSIDYNYTADNNSKVDNQGQITKPINKYFCEIRSKLSGNNKMSKDINLPNILLNDKSIFFQPQTICFEIKNILLKMLTNYIIESIAPIFN